jgi:hypothetical protein
MAATLAALDPASSSRGRSTGGRRARARYDKAAAR